MKYLGLKALCSLFLLFCLPLSAAISAFMTAYRDTNPLEGMQWDQSGVVALVQIVDDIDGQVKEPVYYKLLLPGASHTDKGNLQFLPRMRVIDKNHLIFSSPNGFIYLFDLRVSDAFGDFKLHQTKYDLSWSHCRHLTQPVFYYWLPKRIAGLKQYSPFCITEVFKTRQKDKRYFLGACDDYSFLIQLDLTGPEETGSFSNLQVTPYPITNNLIREPERWVRHHFISGMELVQDSQQKTHALVSMDRYYPPPADRGGGTPFYMASLNLSESGCTWAQSPASIHSSSFPLVFHNRTSSTSTDSEEETLCHYNPGRLYNLTTDPRKRGMVLFDLGMRGEHCLSFDSMYSYSSASELVSGTPLIRFLPPRLESSSHYTKLSGDRTNEKFQPLISCFDGHIYTVVARYRSDPGLEPFNHDLFLLKAPSPEKETQSSGMSEATNRFQQPVSLDWEDVCNVGLPVNEDGIAKFSQCYDQLLLWDSEAEPFTIDLPGL
ncbi:hypothetical protein [Spongorhabdus nitratireducens]